MRSEKTLSKSDFILAQSCPTKLYYKESGYTTNTMDDEYASYLAEGGYLIGTYAQLMYPEGILIEDIDKDLACSKTSELLKQDNAIVFEGGFCFDKVYFRADIIIKEGKNIQLLEVKAKSFDSTEPKLKESEFGNYMDDALFQAIALEKIYPDYKITVGLLMPDKSKTTGIDHLHRLFQVETEENSKTGRKQINVKINFEMGSNEHKELIADSVLSILPLNDRLESNREELEESIQNFSDTYSSGIMSKLPQSINKDCKKCEFKLPNHQGGFLECWGELANVSPHVFDLYQSGKLKDKGLNTLISKKTVSLFDVTDEQIRKGNNEYGAYGIRRKIQIDNTKTNKEWISDKLGLALESITYPVFFIDFETATSALPPFKGMRPYELIAFQWSCHVVRGIDKPVEHYEFISTENELPNFLFAEKLMELVGENESLFMWATHENSTLKTIYNQMDKYGYKNKKLKSWLKKVMKFDKYEGRFIDMNNLTLEHYFHPDMKGRTSIKVTLPAIWKNNSYLHRFDWFKDYESYDENGLIQDPYKTLGNKLNVIEEVDVVSEGTGAMRAYFEMMFGEHSYDDKVKNDWRDSLLNYCKLDTLSMVIIWYHWIKNTSAKQNKLD